MILTAKKITAKEAEIAGVILKAVPRAQVLAESEALAMSILKNGPIAIRQAKYAITQGMNTDLHTGLAIEAKAYELVIPTKDRVEALQAFSEKRQPVFQGK